MAKVAEAVNEVIRVLSENGVDDSEVVRVGDKNNIAIVTVCKEQFGHFDIFNLDGITIRFK